MASTALARVGRPTGPGADISFGTMQVWIDQDLCTGDGICEDYCPEVFVILSDGIAYVREPETVMNDPGQAEGLARVRVQHEPLVLSAAMDCPGECIFIESTA